MDGQRSDETPAGRDEAPGERRPERRLDRPPSDRFRDVEPASTATEARSGPPGVVSAVVAALVGAVALAVGGGLLTITAGLLVIAAVLGWVVAVLVSVGADPVAGRAPRRWAAAAIAVGGVALGQIGLWLIARQEGGTLGVLDYLAETFGVLVPLELALAGGIAWWRTA